MSINGFDFSSMNKHLRAQNQRSKTSQTPSLSFSQRSLQNYTAGKMLSEGAKQPQKQNDSLAIRDSRMLSSRVQAEHTGLQEDSERVMNDAKGELDSIIGYVNDSETFTNTQAIDLTNQLTDISDRLSVTADAKDPYVAGAIEVIGNATTEVRAIAKADDQAAQREIAAAELQHAVDLLSTRVNRETVDAASLATDFANAMHERPEMEQHIIDIPSAGAMALRSIGGLQIDGSTGKADTSAMQNQAGLKTLKNLSKG